MKKVITLILLLLLTLATYAQNAGRVKEPKPPKAPKIRHCKKLYVDLEKGTINGLTAKATMTQVKAKLPCFTGDTEEGSAMNCGGGVFYLNDDFYFYTGRDYIEIRGRFTGKTKPLLLGLYRDDVSSKLGQPYLSIENNRVWLFKYNYGTLRVNFDMDGQCVEIGIHAAAPLDVKLCE